MSYIQKGAIPGHRRARRSAALAMLLALCCCGCAEPFIVLSGGTLSGEEAPPPEDWTMLAEVEVVQLETHAGEPYSVNLWAVGLDDDLYVATGEDGTRWSEYLAEEDDVRVRIEGVIYELEAVPVYDMAERRAVAAAYVRKYDLDHDDSWVERGLLWRLDRP